jgi:hypothetical protein
MFEKSYTRALKSYDKDLFAKRNQNGVMCVFRKAKRFEPVLVSDDFKLFNLIDGIQFIFAITENWTLSTKPRQWGIEFVLNRIKEIDCWDNERMLEELDLKNEKVEASKRRSFKNETEAFFADNRKEFADGIDEIVGCTHTLSKDEPRKRLKDRSIKNGNY